ncbi:MAG: DUF3037 domain-containing protein [Thermomicrobiales bacterium]|nr:DUF3037 domain-containing protein [Thermomicrobiales bacterium]MCO5220852.1 DUF3037 domain-containing protein [Thermomicrobiales bacterium]
MPARLAFEYAVIRIVPRVERAEFINAGVVLICRSRRYLAARVELDRGRLVCLAPFCSEHQIDAIEEQLRLIPRIAAGDPEAGPIARLDFRERWHWLAAPSSTIVQSSPAHTGLCIDPAQQLDALFANLVRLP